MACNSQATVLNITVQGRNVGTTHEKELKTMLNLLITAGCTKGEVRSYVPPYNRIAEVIPIVKFFTKETIVYPNCNNFACTLYHFYGTIEVGKSPVHSTLPITKQKGKIYHA